MIMIRPATINDIPALIKLGAQMHVESPRFCRLRFSPAKVESTLLQLMSMPLGFLWVAEHEEGLIGGLAAVAGPHWCSDDLVANDLALFIDREHRGGISALRLVNRYRCWVKEIGAVIGQLGVTTGIDTEGTANLFERLGFERCGVILEV